MTEEDVDAKVRDPGTGPLEDRERSLGTSVLKAMKTLIRSKRKIWNGYDLVGPGSAGCHD
jgi:hypothetical protein